MVITTPISNYQLDGQVSSQFWYNGNTFARQIYQVANDSLANAYDYMMDWMKGFGEKFDSDEILKGKALSPEKEAILIEEEAKVNKMKAMMLGSIEYAESLLEQKN